MTSPAEIAELVKALREEAEWQLSTRTDILLHRAAAALEEVGKDAQRYRWVRSNGAWESEAWLGSATPEEIDAAIDAAISAEGK